MFDFQKPKKRLKSVGFILVLVVFFGALIAAEDDKDDAGDSKAEVDTSGTEAEMSEKESEDEEESYAIFVPTNVSQPDFMECPPNEEFKQCLVNCTDCDWRSYCQPDCSRRGCDCIRNFFRLTPDGPCEPVAKCPKFECPENEVFRECGPTCEMCYALRCRIISCQHRCYCKQGYFRTPHNLSCVPEEECPPKFQCAENEAKADSGPLYEYCLYADTEKPTNETREEEDCYCLPGYKRNGYGFCIPEIYCPAVHCIDGEKYMECTPKCNTTCRNYGDPDCEEDGQCYPGCFCDKGFLINDYRNCVPLEQCPLGSNPFVPAVTTTNETESTVGSSPITTSSPTPATTTSPTETEEDDNGTATTAATESVTAAEETTVTEATTVKPEKKLKEKSKQKDETGMSAKAKALFAAKKKN